MTEVRCVKCNRLLFKTLATENVIEVKCPKCGFLNEFNLLNTKKVKEKIETYFSKIS